MSKYINKLNIAIYILCVITIVFLFAACSKNSTSHPSNNALVIGVYHLQDQTKNYHELQSDLEKQLGCKIELIELTPSHDQSDLEQIKYLKNLLSQSKVDLILGIPNVYTPQLITQGCLMDITDHIKNIDCLQTSVVDIALKIGHGRIYAIAPIISQCYFLFENISLLEELGIKPVTGYISWDDFSQRLAHIQNQIESQNKTLKPLAMVVQNQGEKSVFIEDDFLMYGYGLDAPLVENNILLGNHKWSSFFLTFSELVKTYGQNYADVDQKYLFDTQFSEGNYASTLGGFYQLELYTTDNLGLNSQLPTKIKINFKLNIVPLPVYPGDEGMLNLRLNSIAINKKSPRKYQATQVLNYILSKDYTMKMIQHRYKYNPLGVGVPFFPVYYDDEIIEQLNAMYNSLFDVTWLYQAKQGAVTYPVYDLEKRQLVYQLLSTGLADIFNNKKGKHEALKSVQMQIP